VEGAANSESTIWGIITNPDSSSRSGRTPLSSAENGHEGIAKLLLGRKDVDPDTPDTMHGQTPLSWAAVNGRVGVVELLTERKDVNPSMPSRYGRTPLFRATKNGHEEVVKLLLGREGVNPDIPEVTHGLTPLSCPARMAVKE